MSFSSLWQLAQHSMKTVARRGTRSSKRSRPSRDHRRPGTKLCLEVLEDRCLLSAGALDPSFGVGGKVTTDFGSTYAAAYSVAVAPGGKIVVAGTTYQGATGEDFAVARYNPDGTLDATFGVGGKVTIDFGSAQDDIAVGVAVLADGRVVVAGHTYNSSTGYDFAVARLTAQGQLDASFGNGGLQTIDFGSSGDFGTGVAVQADGSVVEVGTTYQNNGTQIAVARLTNTGQLDTSFNGTGMQTIAFDQLLQADGVAVRADGSVVVAGTTENANDGTGHFVVARLTNIGELDTSFNTTGKQTISFGADTLDTASGMAVQADGRVVIAGASYNYQGGTGYDFAVARLTNTGQLDTSFNATGKQTISFGPSDDYTSAYGTNVVVQTDGSVVMAGTSNQGGSTGSDFAVARLTNTGQLDGSFGSGGKVTTDFAGSPDQGSGVAIQADGNIVVAGSTYSSDYTTARFAVARYIGISAAPTLYVLRGTSLDQAFIGDIRKQAVDTGNASALLLYNQGGQLLLTLDGESLNYVGGGSAIKGVGYFTSDVANGTKITDFVYDFTVTFYDASGHAIVLDAFSATP